jgi:hypothetical protein
MDGGAGCITLVLTLLGLIASIAFYVMVYRACVAVIVMACKTDHGHGATGATWCRCPCHKPTT